MRKSQAEIQKQYRERKKLREGEEYMKRERERKRKYYVKTSDLSAKKLKKRREEVLKRVKKHYANKKATGGEGKEGGGNGEKLILKFPFKAGGVRKRYKSALRSAQRKIEDLENENRQLKRRNKTIQKRVERTKGKGESSQEGRVASPMDTGTTDEQSLPRVPTTPRSRTKDILDKGGFNEKQRKLVRRKLLLAHVLLEEVKRNVESRKKKSKSSQRVVSGQVIKKYRLANHVGNITGIGRKSICRDNPSKVRKSIKSRFGKVVEDFLQREDNSTVLPGKKDTVRSGKGTLQKRILNDYLHNLYEKFRLEKPNIKISKSVFCRLRPANFLTVSFCNRTKCLCIRHQNFAMKLKALRNQGAAVNVNPDTFVGSGCKDDDDIKSLISEIPRDRVTYMLWKKVDDGGKMRTKLIQTEKPKADFIEDFLKENNEFKQHVERVKNQYGQMRRLRETLNDGHVVVWMDFAENYVCSSMEEVQSAYWNASMVTLHTKVVYFPQSHTKSHMSIVGISEVMSHNATAVHAMISKLIPIIREEYPNIHTIHYLTDSPTSQYRNKTVFNIVCAHKELYGINATWDYLEAGHGKGPCDGLGASVKRSADMSVKQGKSQIQSADDFHRWATNENASVIKYFYVSSNDYQQSQSAVQSILTNSLAVPGTLKIHSVVPLSEMQVAVRDKSCYCAQCSTDVLTSDCPGWTTHDVKKQMMVTNEEQTREVEDESSDVDETSDQHLQEWSNVDVDVGSYVSAVYQEEWFIGQVTEVDADGEVLINFMERAGKTPNYKWPSRRDEIWIPVNKILLKIEEPVPTGKNKRSFKVDSKVAIEKAFSLWKACEIE